MKNINNAKEWTKADIKKLINAYTYKIEQLDNQNFLVTVEEYPYDADKPYWPAYITGIGSSAEKAIKDCKECLEDYIVIWIQDEDYDCIQDPILPIDSAAALDEAIREGLASPLKVWDKDAFLKKMKNKATK